MIKAFDERNNGILKSNYSSISIPLNFPPFQDCIDYNINSGYQRTNHSELFRESVGCHFVESMPINITSLSFDNITLLQNRTEECSWSWRERDNGDRGGLFDVTMKQNLEPVVITKGISGVIPETSKPVHSDVVLALTCDACFKPPCVYKNKDSRVTFAIPFILTNKTYIVKHDTSDKYSNVTTIVLAASVSFLLFIAIVIIAYQCLKRSREKR